MSKKIGIGVTPVGGEEWIPAPRFTGYLVSNLGRVVSIRRKVPVEMKFEADKDGYLRLQLIRDGKSWRGVQC